MAKSDFKDSLKKQMLTMTLVPVVLLTVAIIVTSVSIVRASITNQIEDELIHDAELIGFVFDDFYVGDYRIEETGEEGEIEIYKGEQKLNGEDTLIATMSDFLDIDVSIFIEDTIFFLTLTVLLSLTKNGWLMAQKVVISLICQQVSRVSCILLIVIMKTL